MIKENTAEWHLYIVKWKNGTMSAYILTEEKDEINWLHFLDSEGDPAAAEVRKINPTSGKSIMFEQGKEEGDFHPHVLPEPCSLTEMFDESDEIVWPD
jgi:hypothetical protein